MTPEEITRALVKWSKSYPPKVLYDAEHQKDMDSELQAIEKAAVEWVEQGGLNDGRN